MRLAVPLRQPGVVEAVDQALTHLTGPPAFRFAMIRSGLSACLVYVSHSRILVRPVIPPTAENPIFVGARQRLYLSATLGEGGELERSFGRAPIARLSLPESSRTPRSGRRFFVFPELVPGADPRNLAAQLVRTAGKALVLAPSTEMAVGTATELRGPGWPVLTASDVANGMAPFAELEHATCGLASRYDGLDLPGAACRAVVLEGRPDQDSLQERFLSSRVRAGSALAERVRTRVVQGAGRCTRGPDDWALVVILGQDLTQYLLRPETLEALTPELQAEIRFGIENSDADVASVIENVTVFLDQSDPWRDDAEPMIAEFRHAAERQPPPGTAALGASAPLEIEACTLAAARRWQDASRVAGDAARTLGLGGDATRGYRALWLYLAGVWADQAAADAGDSIGRASARALLDQAEKAAKPSTWTRELAPLPDAAPEGLGAADTTAVAAVAALAATTAMGAHEKKVAAMFDGLAETEPAKYEPGLTTLGRLLGADAQKPKGKGRCDSTWCWDEQLWLAVEAKSDHKPSGLVPHKEVRQANDQLRLLAGDRQRETIPPDSATVIVSPKPAVDPDGAAGAESHVHITDPETVTALARDTAAAWEEILAGRAGREGAALKLLVETALTRRGVLATQVLDRLTRQRVGPARTDA